MALNSICKGLKGEGGSYRLRKLTEAGSKKEHTYLLLAGMLYIQVELPDLQLLFSY